MDFTSADQVQFFGNGKVKDTVNGIGTLRYAGIGIHVMRVLGIGLMDFQLYSRKLTQAEIDLSVAKNRLDGPNCERPLP